MIDISHKSNTFRYAKAEGRLFAAPATLELVRNGKTPKGNLAEVVRAAGIAAAKRTPELIVFSHTIPIDWIELSVEAESDSIVITCEVKSVWRTGVEMEAITGVTAALLNAYDMLKPVDKEMSMGEIKVVEKKGGKSAFRDVFDPPLKAAVLVISDSTFEGTRKDKSGKIIREFLEGLSVDVSIYEVLPDDPEKIKTRLIELVDEEKMQLVITTGGTGLGPKDLTPEATMQVIDKEVTGIEEAIRVHGINRTPYAMLSRLVCGMRGESLIINLPGSSNGAREGLDALFPGMLHAFKMIRGGGH